MIKRILSALRDINREASKPKTASKTYNLKINHVTQSIINMVKLNIPPEELGDNPDLEVLERALTFGLGVMEELSTKQAKYYREEKPGQLERIILFHDN